MLIEYWYLIVYLYNYLNQFVLYLTIQRFLVIEFYQLIYIHYNNLNSQEVMKRKILPLEIDTKTKEKENDFASEGDLFFIIWNLISLYVTTEIKIAEAWSWASENVKRQAFTNESLKKIDEREEIRIKKERKEKSKENFKIIVESINRRVQNNKNKEE